MQTMKVRSTAFAVIDNNKTEAQLAEVTRVLSTVILEVKLPKVKPTSKAASAEVTEEEITSTEAVDEIINFELKTIEAPLLHQKTKNWIIFSDLHVKRYVCIYIR
jgi:arsenate reductase-like glutaredoxin family protein